MRSGLTYGESSTGNLPNITGAIGYAESHRGVSGCFYDGATEGSGYYHRANTGSGKANINFDASRSSSIYGRYSDVDKVLPSFITMHYIIKH